MGKVKVKDRKEITGEKVARPKNDAFEPKIVAFLCNWCSYAGADLAGTSRIQYPANVRIIRIPCTGRIDPIFVVRALLEGADGVLVSGCHPGECHYTSGNYYARRRFTVLRELLDLLGVEPERLTLSWVSASEGEKFSEVVEEVVESVKQVGPARRLVRAREFPGESETVCD